MEGVIESAHMGRPDVRANGRIFATLRGDRKHGMVVLTPDEQARFIAETPDTFAPERRGDDPGVGGTRRQRD